MRQQQLHVYVVLAYIFPTILSQADVLSKTNMVDLLELIKEFKD